MALRAAMGTRQPANAPPSTLAARRHGFLAVSLPTPRPLPPHPPIVSPLRAGRTDQAAPSPSRRSGSTDNRAWDFEQELRRQERAVREAAAQQAQQRDPDRRRTAPEPPPPWLQDRRQGSNPSSSSSSSGSSSGGRRPKLRRGMTQEQQDPAIAKRQERRKKIREHKENPQEFVKPRPIPDKQLLHFELRGWVAALRLLSAKQVEELRGEVDEHLAQHMLQALKARVQELCPEVPDPAATVTSEERAWAALSGKKLGTLKFQNPHRTNLGFLNRMAQGIRLGGFAAQLLNVKRVRLYQTCVHYFPPGFTGSEWSSDLVSAPFDTSQLITCWIPLQLQTASELRVASGSQRDFALPFWQRVKAVTPQLIKDRQYSVETPAVFELGDSTWLHGWTLHRAEPTPELPLPRAALAVTYVAADVKLFSTKSPSLRRNLSKDREYQEWRQLLGGDGAGAKHALLPIAYGGTDS